MPCVRGAVSPIAIGEHVVSPRGYTAAHVDLRCASQRQPCAMDAFFGGLDSRLRVSVKAADSIMVGLVNAAMEEAYKKSLWKDGDLERLFHKLRFAELAVMQLEWCLRFVRGDMEADDGREQLLDDLLETRDRIQARLGEAELAVAETDRDYMRRKRRDLAPARGPETPSAADRRGAEVEGGAFPELRGSVDRKMSRMRARLEDASSTLAALMDKVSREASPMARLQEAGHEGDGVRGLSVFYSMAQLLMEFQEMAQDAGAVRDSVASSFDAMERSISALRAAMDEQRWLVDSEKEMYAAVVEGFLREINMEPMARNSSAGERCQPPTLHRDRGATENSSDESQSLKDETGQLHSARPMSGDKSESRQCYHSEEHCISQEEAERLTEGTIDSETRCELQHVLYSAVFRDMTRKLAVQANDVQKLTEQRDGVEIRSKLQCEIHSVIFKEVIDHIFFGGSINDDHNLGAVKYKNQYIPNDNLGRFSMIDTTEQLENVKMQVKVDEGADPDRHQVLVNQDVLGKFDNCDSQNSKVSAKQDEASADRDTIYGSGNGNAEEGLDDHRNLQTGEVAIGLGMPPEGANRAMCIALTSIHEMAMNFDATTCGKIETAALRLRNLDKQLSNLIGQVNSLKTSELIYRRAFTRRCCDLQTAEAEVDLLGDEVELLSGLLRRTYKALDHYSPVLQHYVGIREMLSLLGKELAVRHQVQ
ncbi:hypothetical protein BS78_06G161900 [Paspalum vaginatum]|nr:hypothetical protein BS78_06G161900 [Paspalum vaginatum]